MKEFFGYTLAGLLLAVLIYAVGTALSFADLSFLGYRTNMQTHITRQTNAYITAHQSALRTLKSSYDDLVSKETPDTELALSSQKRGIIKQMHEEADLIPNDIQSDIANFLATNN